MSHRKGTETRHISQILTNLGRMFLRLLPRWNRIFPHFLNKMKTGIRNILNKNLLRILRERANADRSITPKKQHHGYIILCSQQLNENHKKDGISTWKTQIQTPYPVTLKSYEIQGQIFQDFVDKDIFSEMRIDSADADKDSDYIAKMQDYLFKANSRTGLWEVELYTTGEITIPQNMLQPKKNTAGSCKSFQKDSIKSNVR